MSDELVTGGILERRQRMFGNRPLLRMFLRSQLRRDNLTEDQKKGIQKILKDGDAMDSVLLELAARPQAPGDGVKFLDWLIANADEILAIVLKIISLL